jgi:hypothetical protein
MLRYCPKDKLMIEEEFFCKLCIFTKRDPFKGMFFRDCEYDLWQPGLKQDNPLEHE